MVAASAQRPDQQGEATPLELFFDLVFVFAVLQLSHYLLAHLSWRAIGEMLVLLLAVYAVWFSTSWQATVIGPDEPRTQRMVLTVMVLGLFMNAAVTEAFMASGWAFVVPLLLIQLGRTFWMLVNAPNALYREHYVRTLLWLTATAPLWIAGAAVDPGTRLPWWALAAGIDLIGRALAHPVPGRQLHSEHIPFPGEHVVERCRQFLLIVLGEIVLATGLAIAAAPMTPLTVFTGTVALVGAVALWRLGFGRAGRVVLRYVEATTDPIRASRHASDTLTVMVAGLVAVAVANAAAIAHPRESAAPILTVLMYGGPILYLLAQGWYFWFVLQVQPRLRLIGSAGLVLAGVATLTLTAPLAVALLLVGTLLTIIAVLDQP